MERIENCPVPTAGWEIDKSFLLFLRKHRIKKIKAGLLAHLTFAGLLPGPIAIGAENGIVVQKHFSDPDGYRDRTDLQLRGQLRFRTGFPFHPERQADEPAQIGNLNRKQSKAILIWQKSARPSIILENRN